MLDEKKLEAVHVDYQMGIRRFAGKESLYEKYLFKFLEDTHYAEACAAMEKKNYAEVLSTVHALKGMTGTLGMDSVFESCAKIVSDIREERTADVEVHFTILKEQYELVCNLLAEMKENG
ncbi:MAG: Hpt domain-containing protein [Lachnospiraceae bacterium]|nr:Hpt domain-containing protein [Lachnospiraceae bacterium]